MIKELVRIDPSQLKKGTFHAVEVAGYRFEACITGDGPYLIPKDLLKRSSWASLGVPLGDVGEIWNIEPKLDASSTGFRRGSAGGIWLCKYGPQEPRDDLSRLSVAEAAAIATEFGIENYSGGDDDGEGIMNRFFSSPAWQSLVQAVQSAPRFWANRAHCNDYIEDWYEMALNQSID